MPTALKVRLLGLAKVAIPIAITIAAVAFVAQSVDWSTVVADALRAPLWAIFVSAALMWVQLALCGLRLKWLAQAINTPATWQASTAVWGISYLASLVLPTTVGGDVVKGFVMLRWTRVPKRILGIVALERVAATIALMILVLLAATPAAYYARFGHEPVLAAISVAGLVTIVITLAKRRQLLGLLSRLLPRRIPKERIEAISDTLAKAPIGKAILLSVAIHALTIVILALLMLGFSTPNPALEATLGGPLVTFASMLPISVGGFGIREGAFILVFGPFGIEATRAASIAMAWWGVQLLAAAAAAIASVAWLTIGGHSRADAQLSAKSIP